MQVVVFIKISKGMQDYTQHCTTIYYYGVQHNMQAYESDLMAATF